MMEGSDYPQSAASPQSMDSVLTSEGKMLEAHATPLSYHNKQITFSAKLI